MLGEEASFDRSALALSPYQDFTGYLALVFPSSPLLQLETEAPSGGEDYRGERRLKRGRLGRGLEAMHKENTFMRLCSLL